jgi:hypothetical protein
VVKAVRSVGEGMRRYWRNNEGIYRASSRAAARREEQRGLRGDNGWKHDPRDEREVKRHPSDCWTCCRWVPGRRKSKILMGSDLAS